MIRKEKFLLSIVIPFYNETENIIALYESLMEALCDYNYEVVFVDDGSTDTTLNKIKEIHTQNPYIKYISFSRNFGHQNALKAGLDSAKGDCVISMDADLQHPPELIKKLVSKWQEGFDVVYTIRKDNKKTGFLKKLTSALFYRLIKSFSNTKIHKGAADFRLLDKRVIEEIKAIKENYLFIRGLISWMGFEQTQVEYLSQERFAGKTKYNFRKMWKFAFSGITSFSTKPLQISTIIGFVIAFAAFIYGIYAIIASLFTDINIETGWTSLVVSVLFIGGLQLIMIGIIGEYLGKMFIENKRRPNYIIKESNIEKNAK